MMPSKLGKSIYYSILLRPVLKISLFVCTSHPLWHSQPSITTWIIHGGSKARLKTENDIIYAELQDHCCKRLSLKQPSQSLARTILYPVFSLTLDPPCIIHVAIEGPAMYNKAVFKCRA